ncbi:MAG TPA: ABC transporter permease subunit [Streptosporangiaceae bacterium]|nr:ABC transporter permease subunit [Streptosporangiaceae bacterium]
MTATQPLTRRPIVADAIHSEWVKLSTTRSTYWALLTATVGMTGFGALLCAAYTRHDSGLTPSARAAFDPAAYSLSGFFLGQLAVAVLGVLTITGEYAGGTIRPTLAATPQRTTVLAAKAVVFTVIAIATGTVMSLVAFFTGQAILSSTGSRAHITDPGTIRSVAGAVLYLTVLGLLALGLGTIIRRTAGAVAAVTGLVIILPVLVQGLPAAWQNAVARYLPSAAGQAIIGRTKFTPHGPMLPPWPGFAVFCAYTAAVLAVSALLLSKRDS